MKKLLLSALSLGVVAVVAVFATQAYFSDEETSVGNTFTAGKLDLTVDSECHYNGLVCKNVATGGPEVYQWQDGDQIPDNNPGPNVIGDPCSCTWLSKDLATGDLFYDYVDVKPGDEGENTI